MLKTPPKKTEIEAGGVTRLCQPVWRPEENCYEMFMTLGGETEVHKMRYLFVPELKEMASNVGFRAMDVGTLDNWGALVGVIK